MKEVKSSPVKTDSLSSSMLHDSPMTNKRGSKNRVLHEAGKSAYEAIVPFTGSSLGDANRFVKQLITALDLFLGDDDVWELELTRLELIRKKMGGKASVWYTIWVDQSEALQLQKLKDAKGKGMSFLDQFRSAFLERF